MTTHLNEKSLSTIVRPIRESFLKYWEDLIRISLNKDVAEQSERLTRDAKKKKVEVATAAVYDILRKYTYELHKAEFPEKKYLERKDNESLVDEVGNYLKSIKAKLTDYKPLLDKIKVAYATENNYRSCAFKILKREFLFKQINLSNQIDSLNNELASLHRSFDLKTDKERTALHTQITDCLLSKEALTNTVSDLTAQLEGCKDKVDNKQFFAEFERTKDELNTVRRELENKEQNITELFDKFEDFRAEHKEKVEQLVHDYNILSQRNTELQQSTNEHVLFEENQILLAQIQTLAHQETTNQSIIERLTKEKHQ